MALHDLEDWETMLLEDMLVENPNETVSTVFQSNSTGSPAQGNVVVQDANLASGWLNTPSFTGFNVSQLQSEHAQGEVFSDTESVTSSSYSAVPSPAAVFDNTEQQQQRFSFYALQDEDLKHLSVKDLNRRLKGMPKETVSLIKKRRRTLKNRGYAHSCRIKRVLEKNSLQNTKVDLEAVNQRLQDELSMIRNERDRYKQAYENLIQLIQAQGQKVNQRR
ncbi:transcription factor MafG-like [Dendronephthya gigantea]|uniref:transcription factor MafG-like n=1 Tax=Dendronephthya gigantea TaxID=151771 RepID=UPI00106CDB27|nr:transcription factor MafG-like [Dendronephthya gigantea]